MTSMSANIVLLHVGKLRDETPGGVDECFSAYKTETATEAQTVQKQKLEKVPNNPTLEGSVIHSSSAPDMVLVTTVHVAYIFPDLCLHIV